MPNTVDKKCKMEIIKPLVLLVIKEHHSQMACETTFLIHV